MSCVALETGVSYTRKAAALAAAAEKTAAFVMLHNMCGWFWALGEGMRSQGSSSSSSGEGSKGANNQFFPDPHGLKHE